MTDSKKQEPSLAQKALTAAGIGAATGALLFGGKKLLGRRGFKGSPPAPQMKPSAPTPLLPAPSVPAAAPEVESPYTPRSLKRRKEDIKEAIANAHSHPNRAEVIKGYKKLKKVASDHEQRLKKNPNDKRSRELFEDVTAVLKGIRHLIPKAHQ